MARISAEHVNTFLMAATKVISEACMLQPKVGKPSIRSGSYTNDSIVIMIGVTGEMQGQVLLVFKKEVALTIASKMMFMEVTQLDEISTSAICELGNMIMGNASTVFSTKNIGIDITPPTMCEGNFTVSGAVANMCIPIYINDTDFVELDLCVKQD
ncbi:MAG: chemotaxis protein CheX [Lachnospiraceae bacterium]|nr:chemotaxis protein CheX [Lachnospiraceae bacterium]